MYSQCYTCMLVCKMYNTFKAQSLAPLVCVTHCAAVCVFVFSGSPILAYPKAESENTNTHTRTKGTSDSDLKRQPCGKIPRSGSTVFLVPNQERPQTVDPSMFFMFRLSEFLNRSTSQLSQLDQDHGGHRFPWAHNNGMLTKSW